MDLKGAKYLEKLVLYFLAVRRLRNWGRPPQIPSALQHKKSFAGEVRLPVWASIQGHSIGGCCGHCNLQESRHLSSTHSETRHHAVLPQLEKFENEQRLHEKGREREREEQFARLSHACSASEASTVKTALGSKQEFPLLWTACLP